MTEESKDVRETKPRKGKGDPFGAVFWGLVLIWFGFSILVIKVNWLHWFLFGLGVIFIVDGLLRQLQSELSKAVRGKYITGVVLILVSLALTYWSKDWWPLVPIVVGIGILAAGIMKIRESQGT
jgi:uncharacterized membrane protein HdeD (DUF308 family)